MEADKFKKHLQDTAWVAYLSPFRLIVPDGEEPLKVDLKDINSNTYDHGQLCRIVSKYTIESFSYDLLICYDGALAIPKTDRFQEKEQAVDFFNNFFCKILIGGIFCEAIDRRDVVSGRLFERRAIWPVDFGKSASTHLHSKLRMRVAGSIDSIILSNPKFIRVKDLHASLELGSRILSQIDNLTPKFLIRGITEISYKNWDLVLSNLWITVEQLIDCIWFNVFLKDDIFHTNISVDGRKSSFREDNRTWSNSVKQEILYQSKLIDEEIISKLSPARRARNKLVHEGKGVSQKVAIDLFHAVQLLISRIMHESFSLINILDVSPQNEQNQLCHNYDCFEEWKIVSKKVGDF